MAFNKSNPFARSQSLGYGGSSKKPFNPPTFDHLVTVESFDFEKHTITGTNHMGKRGVYRIGSEAFARGEKSQYKSAKFMGHRIDEKMAEHIKPGHKIVMERSKWISNGKDGVNHYESTRVINSTAQDSNKLFNGLFSAQKYEQRIVSVQHWDKQAFSVADKEKLAAFVAELDSVYKKVEAGEHVPYRGFQIRAMREGDDGWVCFDSTLPYDYTAGTKDESGNVLTKAMPISRDVFIRLCKEYQQYLLETYPTFKEDGCKLDIMTFTNFKASNMSRAMALGHEFSALNRITKVMSKQSSDDEEGYNSRNMAAWGIIELTEDEMVREGRNVTFKDRNLVQKLHVNNYIGDTRTMVLAFDGRKVRLADELKPPMAENTAKSLVHFKEEIQQTPKVEDDSQAIGEEWEEKDPFMEEIDNPW
jgi:hypothetical protein